MSAEVTLGWNNARLAAGARLASSIVDSTTAKMRSAFAGIAATGGAFLGVREIVEATVKYDSLRLGMVSLTGSVEAANDRLGEMREAAKSPGLGFEQAVDADIKLQSVGLSAGLSARAIIEMGNALAVVGKGKADLDGVLLAITQIVSKGKVSAEEINQIAERVPQIRRVMKDVLELPTLRRSKRWESRLSRLSHSLWTDSAARFRAPSWDCKASGTTSQMHCKARWRLLENQF